MPLLTNPLKDHDVSDLTDVYVPLEYAMRNATVVAGHNEKLGISSGTPVNDEEGRANIGSEYSANTLEGLRAEIDLGTLER